MSILSRERAPAPASAAQALIAEARRRQRRRRSGIAIVLAAIVGGVAAFAGLGGGGGASGPARARYASGGQVRAFLAAAERPVGGTFSVSYAVTAGHGASTYHADITAGQNSGGPHHTG